MKVAMKANDAVPHPDRSSPDRASSARVEGRARRPYATPRLVSYGKLRDVTLGGSPGMFDSGSVANKMVP